MIYVFLGMSLLFIGIGFLVNKKNAKNILAGYNTMSEEERKKVDIKNYIPFFRKFHIYLGLSFGILGILINEMVNENAGGIFLAMYPIIAYSFFLWKSRNYSTAPSSRWSYVAILALFATGIFVLGLLYYGFKENEIIFNEQQIEITGMYGKTIKADEIAAIELVKHPPAIKFRSNGFALGFIRKGYFRTKEGETVLLILNADRRPLILIKTKQDLKIYYSAKNKPNSEIFKKLRKTFPNISLMQF